MDPLVLLKFFHAGIDDRTSRGLGVKRGEVSLGDHPAHQLRGLAGIHKVIDQEPARAVTFKSLEHLQFSDDVLCAARGG